MAKQENKRKQIYRESYKKNTIAQNPLKISKLLLNKQTKVYVLEGAVYSDNTESMTIKIDNLPH